MWCHTSCVMLFDDYPCLFSGVALRLASCGRWMKRGSLLTWWAAPPSAPSWEHCTLRRRATAAWGSGLVSGQWCVEHYTEERKAHLNKTLVLLLWHLLSYLSASQTFSLHDISEFLHSLPIITHMYHLQLLSFLRIWPLTLRRSWIWPTLSPPCFLELPLTLALALSSRTNR